MSETTPGTLGDALGAAAQPAVITWNGTAYRVARPTVKAVELTEAFVAGRMHDEVDALRGAYSPERYAEEKAAVRAAITARKHWFAGEQWASVMTGPDGLALILLACLRAHHPAVTEDDVRGMMRDDPEACKDALADVTPDFFRAGATRVRIAPALVEPLLAAFMTALTTAPPSTP